MSTLAKKIKITFTVEATIVPHKYADFESAKAWERSADLKQIPRYIKDQLTEFIASMDEEVVDAAVITNPKLRKPHVQK